MRMMLANIPNGVPDYHGELERLVSYGDGSSPWWHVLFDDSDLPPWVNELLPYLLGSILLLGAGYMLWNIFADTDTRTTGDAAPDLSGIGGMGSAEDADIHVEDLDEALTSAMSSGDYAKAVHMHYLLTLRELDAQGRIVWQQYKTPAMYISELQTSREELRELTLMFLYIRYGHYPALLQTAEKADQLRRSIIFSTKGGSL